MLTPLRSLSAAAAILLGAAAAVSAQTGSISGRVSDELLAPVDALGVELQDDQGNGIAWTSTDPGGNYSFTALADGDYLVRADSDPARDLVGEYWGGAHRFDWDLASRIEVSGGTAVTGKDLALSPGGSISGTLSGLSAGESVGLTLYDAFNGRWRGYVDSDPTTFAYVFDSVAAGSYTLWVHPTGTDRAIQWYDGRGRGSLADTIPVAADEDVAPIDLTLTPGTSISGTVTLSPDPGDGGATVQQIRMDAIDAATHEWVLTLNPSSDGSYSLSNLPPGSYLIQAESSWTGFVRQMWVSSGGPVYNFHEGEPIAVDPATPRSGIDFLLEEGNRISGQVFIDTNDNDVQEAGEPDVTQAGVHAHQLDGGYWTGGGTDGSGGYSVGGLAPGSYQLSIESRSVEQPFVAERWSGHSWYEQGDPVDVSSGDRTDIHFGVVQDRVISGQIFLDLDADQTRDPDEPPISWASVRVYEIATNWHVGHAAVAPDGSYSIGVRAGLYRVEADPHGHGLLREWWQDVFFQSAAASVDVRTADATGVDFGLVQGSTYGTLRGRLVDAVTLTGIPDVDVWVELWPRGEGWGNARSDAAGYFVMANLPPASYRVTFGTERSNRLHDTDYLIYDWSASGDPGDADPVDYPAVPGGGTDLGDFALAEGGSLSGTVHPPSGYALPLPLRVNTSPLQAGVRAQGTDAESDGTFRIRGLVPGDYHVYTAPGGDFAQAWYSTAGESTFDESTATPVSVETGLDTPDVDLWLLRGGSISGRITRASDGSPVVGFPIYAELVDDPQGRTYWPGHTSTDSNGEYRFTGLPSGGYRVQTDGRGNWDLANQEYPGTVDVVAPADTPDIDFALEAGGRILGTVTLAVDGSPAVGLRVDAWEPDGRFGSDGTTDANGDYVIGGLPQGRSYWVQVRPQDSGDPAHRDLIPEYYPDSPFQGTASAVAIGTGSGVVDVPGIDFDLALGGTITGTVRDEATTQPIGNFRVVLADPASGNHLRDSHTGADGTYELRGTADGSYVVRADAWGWDYVGEYYLDTTDLSLAELIPVPAAPPSGPVPVVENIDFDLAPGFSIRGIVTEQDGVTAIPGLRISLQGPQWTQAVTRGDGTYELRGLIPGQYTVAVETGGTPWARADQDVDLSSGSASGVDFALGPGASILGNVVDDDFAQPLEGIQVSAHDFYTGHWTGGATSDSLGNYEIDGLGAGVYSVQTDTDERNYVRTYWRDRLDGSDPLTMPEVEGVPQDVDGIDFRLVKGFAIHGFVWHDLDRNGLRDPGEPALSNVGLHGRSADGSLGIWTHARSDGTYTFHGVPSGYYRVRAQGGGNLLPEYWNNVFFQHQATLVDATGGDAENIDFGLVDSTSIGTLRGQVTGSAGLEGISVWVGHFDTGEGVGGTQTDANGNFVVANLPPGSYKVSFDASEYNAANGTDYVSTLWSSTGEPGVIDPELLRVDFPAVEGDGTDLGPFALPQGSSISGRVIPPAGVSLPPGYSVGVESFESGGRPVGSVQVDALGDFVFRGLPAPSTYRVFTEQASSGDLGVVYYWTATESTFDHNTATAIQLAADLPTSGIDLYPFEGGSIEGRITRTDTGEPVVNFPVTSHLENDPLGRGYWYGGAQTDLDGNYFLRGLPSGEYRVRTNSRDSDLGNQTYPTLVPVTAPEPTLGIDFQLDPAGTIRGRVTQIVGGLEEPVVNLRVEAGDVETGQFASDAHTDADGFYAIRSLARGRDYVVQVIPWEGPDPQFFNFIIECWNDRKMCDQADPVSVPTADPGEVIDIDFLLELGGAISGRVTSEATGTPLQNVQVCANDWAERGWGNCDQTDHNGFYVVRGLPAGPYRVEARPHPQDYAQETYDNVRDRSDATQVSVAEVPEGGPIPITENIDFALGPAYRVRGTVTDAATGEPVAGVGVTVHGNDFGYWNGTSTRADGTYELRGQPPGSYQVVANPGDYARQAQEVEITDADVVVDFALEPAASIRGRIYVDLDNSDSFTEGDLPGAGVDVSAEDYSTEEWIHGGTADEFGVYEIPGLPVGSYRVYLEANELNLLRMYYDGELDWENATPVVIQEVAGEPQDRLDVDFQGIQGWEIRGEVFYDANGDGVRQAAVEPRLDLQVRAEDEWNHYWSWQEDDGTYVIHSVPPGEYRVAAHAEDTPYASEYFAELGGVPAGAPFRDGADLIQVESDTPGIDFSIDLGGGVSGTVVDRATLEPLAGIEVGADPFEPESGPWARDETDAEGRFHVRGLPEGSYNVWAGDWDGDYVWQNYDDVIFYDDATPVLVVARSSIDDPLATPVDFRLDKAGVLEGTVYDAETLAGIGGVWVEVEEFAEPHRGLGGEETEPDGTFHIAGLPPDYDLRVWVETSSTDYISVIWDDGDDLGSYDWSQAQPITVGAGAIRPGVDFALERGGSIKGRVVDGNGDPIEDLRVHVNPYDPGFGGGSAQTGPDGYYEIRGLIPGEYRVETGGGPYRWEYYDNQTDWNAAARVEVTAGSPTPNVDFVLSQIPAIVSGPTPAEGERGTTVTGITVVADNLAGGLCGEPAVAPCVRLSFGGSGLTVQNASLDAPSGTITFDLAIAADATLGRAGLVVVNDQVLEDGAASLPSAFGVQPNSGGDAPAPSSERIYAIDAGASELRVYGAADHYLLGRLPVMDGASGLLASPDSSHLFVSGGRKLSVIDTRLGPLGEEVARIRLYGSYGTRPLALGTDYLFSADREVENRIQLVDATTWEVQEHLDIPLTSAPFAIHLDPTGQRLWVVLRNEQAVAVVDVATASPTFRQVLATVPVGSRVDDVGLVPDGAFAYVATNGGLYAVDTALALTDPANAASLVYPAGGGRVEIVTHASGRVLGFSELGETIGVFEMLPGVAEPLFLGSVYAGQLPWVSDFKATSEHLYIANQAVYELHAADISPLLAGQGEIPTVRFDARPDGQGLIWVSTLQIAATPGSPPASAPVVEISSGSPARSGTAFALTLTGGPFDPSPRVQLQGTQVEGSIRSATSDTLQVDFPETTPTGDYRVAVTHALPGGPQTGLSATPLQVLPAESYSPQQTLYGIRYGRAEIGVLYPDGSRDVSRPQPFPAGMSITPDGRFGLVAHFDWSEWRSWELKPESMYDMSLVDLDPASDTYLEVVGTIPWVWASFSPPAVTPTLENPNGVLFYAANRYMSDTVSVIDPLTGTEVDLDGDPATESIPWQHPYWWWWWEELPNALGGISRIELDGDVLDRSLQPMDVGLTPDGSLLYVANRWGTLSVVDTVTHQVVAELTGDGSLSEAFMLEAAPQAVSNTDFVYVQGNDTSGRKSLFVFEAGDYDDGTALVDQIVLPIQDENPREMTISGDGKTVYITVRYAGVLLAMDVQPAQRKRGEYTSICITEHGTEVRSNSLCSDVSQPIPGLLHAVEAAGDGLLYVNHSFGEQIWVLDASSYALITALGDEVAWMAVEPPELRKPAISAVSPAEGSPEGGEPVVISGAEFLPGAKVYFGANLATGVVVESRYTIRALTPASTPTGWTGPVEVKVENPDGKTGSRPQGFNYRVDVDPPVFEIPAYVAGQALVGDPGTETVTAQVQWETDEASDSLVEYRKVGDPEFLSATDPELVREHLVHLTGLEPGTDYELRATSADARGNAASSPAGTEPPLGFPTRSAPDVTPPVILSGPAVAVTLDSAVIQWETDEVASSLVHWDTVVGDGTLDRQSAGPQGPPQEVTLTGLTPATWHEYSALSVDLSGNGPVRSAVETFRTDLLPDADPPVITYGPEVHYLANDLVIIYWETDEWSTSFVNYGVSSIEEQSVVDVDLVEQHVVFLTNLEPGTAYGYQAGSTDPSGNTVLSIDPFESVGPLAAGTEVLAESLRVGAVTLREATTLTAREAATGFTTPALPDTTPPVVLSTRVTALSPDRALVEAEVDEAASLRARYGLAGLEASAFDPNFRRAPSLVLTGLEAASTYELALELTDPKGNRTLVSDLTFTTPAAPDETPPVITGLAVDPVAESSATIRWTTDEAADASVRFGLAGGPLDRQAGRLGLRTTHAVTLGALEPATAYDFEVASRDTSGNRGTAGGSFTTLAAPPRITSVAPSRAAVGASLTVAINGAHFGADAAVAFGAGVTLDAVAVNATGSQVRATITIDLAAAVGARQVTVDTHGYSVSATFTVVDETPPAVSITAPADGAELETATVTVTGTVSEPAEVTVNGLAATVTGAGPVDFEATVTLAGAGPQRIVATALDPSGNRGTAVIGVTVLNQPPVAQCQDVVVALGPDCTAAASIDAGSYDPDGDPITLAQVPAGPFGPGLHPVELTVEDDKGASASCTASVLARFDFDGFLPPIDGADETGGGFGDPVRTFKAGSTIPVKFRISCADNAYVDGVHTLQTVLWTSETASGDPIDATPQDAATEGNAFRLAGEEWHFNLDTHGTGMGEGQWQILATLSDGTQHAVWVQLK